MGFPTKVQLIQRKGSQQWYINFPSAVAQAMEFQRGEIVEGIVEDKNRLLLRRRKVPTATLKKKTRQGVMGSWNALFDQARGFHAATLCGAGASLGLSLSTSGPPHLSGLRCIPPGNSSATGQQPIVCLNASVPKRDLSFLVRRAGATAGGGRAEKAIRFLDQADLEVKSASEYEHGQRR